MSRNLAIATAYYTAVGEKRIADIEKYLHPDVQFLGPIAKLMGKEAVLEGTKIFTTAFKSLTIRTSFSSEDQALLVYDLEIPEREEKLPVAVLMTFQEGLVTKIEPFFDARPFFKQ